MNELIKGSTKTLVLSVLSEKDMYGYEIIKQIRAKSSKKLDFGEGSIYPALHTLEKTKLVDSYWVTQENLPDRKYYKITTLGRARLISLLNEWREFVGAVGSVYDSSPVSSDE